MKSYEFFGLSRVFDAINNRDHTLPGHQINDPRVSAQLQAPRSRPVQTDEMKIAEQFSQAKVTDHLTIASDNCLFVQGSMYFECRRVGSECSGTSDALV